MAKLLFEDDSGSQHEIKLSSISKKSIKKDDVIVAYLEVGNLPMNYVKNALDNLKTILEGLFECRVSVSVMHGGVKDVELNIIKKE